MLRKILLTATLISILILSVSLGIYNLNKRTQLLNLLIGQVPALKDGISFMHYAGEDINQNLNAGKTGIEEYIDSSPYLKSAISFTKNMADSVFVIGQNSITAVEDSLFPDPQTKIKQANARMVLASLNKQIEAKQQEMENLKQKMNQLETKKSILQKIVNPFKNLQPEGFNFLAFPPLPFLSPLGKKTIESAPDKTNLFSATLTGKDEAPFPVKTENPKTTTPNPNFATDLKTDSNINKECSCP